MASCHTKTETHKARILSGRYWYAATTTPKKATSGGIGTNCRDMKKLVRAIIV
jgi:hypothetical protein